MFQPKESVTLDAPQSESHKLPITPSCAVAASSASGVTAWTTRRIGAVRIHSTDAKRNGVFCQLPVNAELTLLEGGLDRRTVTIRFGTELYVVFVSEIRLMARVSNAVVA